MQLTIGRLYCMSVFNQNNNNYGDGFQINTQNQYQSSQDNDLTKLLEELKQLTISLPLEAQKEANELIQTLEETPENDFSKPCFISRVSCLLTKLPGTIATTMNMSSDVEKIISVIDRIKNTLSNLWK